MKLAEYEAETICNLEKENFKLIDTLNSVEENLLKEKEKNNQLTAIHEVKKAVVSGPINRYIFSSRRREESLPRYKLVWPTGQQSSCRPRS